MYYRKNSKPPKNDVLPDYIQIHTHPCGTAGLKDTNNFFLTRSIKRNYYSFEAVTSAAATDTDTTIKLHGGLTTTNQNYKLFRQPQMLDWNNCWCFGNGVESDRIRDDFNEPFITNGVKASTTIQETYQEDAR